MAFYAFSPLIRCWTNCGDVGRFVYILYQWLSVQYFHNKHLPVNFLLYYCTCIILYIFYNYKIHYTVQYYFTHLFLKEF